MNKPFNCHLCAFSSHFESNLKRHRSAVHDKIKQFKCEHCAYEAGQRTHLKKHMRARHRDLSLAQNQISILIPRESQEESEGWNEGHNASSSNSLGEPVDANMRKVSFIAAQSEENQEVLGNVKENIYCQQCHKSNTEANLFSHANIVHGHEKPYHCQHCDYASQKRSNLIQHVKVVHYKIRVKKICPHCDYSTDRSNYLINHMIQEHATLGVQAGNTDQIVSHRLSTNSLLRETTDAESLSNSVALSSQKGAPNFIIENFPNSDTLDIVDQTNDECNDINQKSVYCQCCSKSNTKANILWHVNIISDDVKKFHCRHCNHSSKRKVNLLKHVKAVHYKMKEKCPHCNFTSAWNICIRYHMQTRHSQLGLVIEASSSNNTLDVVDMSKGKGNIITQKVIYCQHCNKSNAKANMLWHVDNTSDDMKKFHCRHCSQSYTRKENLLQHVKVVHYKMRDKCPHCNYMSGWKRDMKNHIQKNHEEIYVQSGELEMITWKDMLGTDSDHQETNDSETVENFETLYVQENPAESKEIKPKEEVFDLVDDIDIKEEMVF